VHCYCAALLSTALQGLSACLISASVYLGPWYKVLGTFLRQSLVYHDKVIKAYLDW